MRSRSEGAVEDHPANPLGVLRSVGDRRHTTPGDAEKDEGRVSGFTNDRLEVEHVVFGREGPSIPVRQAAAMSVVEDQGVSLGQPHTEVLVGRGIGRIPFEMSQTSGRHDEHWAAAHDAVGRHDAVGSLGITHFKSRCSLATRGGGANSISADGRIMLAPVF